MKNKKFIVVGLIIILVIGIASVFATGEKDKSWFGHKDWKRGGKHFNKNFGDKSSLLEKLGLPSDANKAQIREASKGKWEQKYIKSGKKLKEKLGLPEDASKEEIKETLQMWQEENKGHLSGFGYKRHKFHKKSWHKRT